MISKSIRILALILVPCFCLLSFGIGQQHIRISIGSSGTISLKRSYICGNYNSTHYYARNNVTGNYELISTDATQTISYALSKLTPGRTWQETVLLKGTFSIGTTVTVSVGNVLLDFSQASVTVAASIIAFRVNAGANNSTFYGGEYDPFTNTGIHSHWTGTSGSSALATFATNTVVDGFEFTGFTTTGVYASDGSSALTVKKCYFHDMDLATHVNLLRISGYHNITNCKFNIDWTGIMINPGCWHNRILGCEFLGWKTDGGHAIYSDGGTRTGYNEIANCYFHDGINGAACIIKSQNNDIHGNRFYTFTATNVYGICIFSELSTYTANDNTIHHNHFRDFTGWTPPIKLGHDVGTNAPTSRNIIYSNIFENVANCFRFMSYTGTVDDTKIYYNEFYNCANPFPNGLTASLVQNTVIAYNYFNASVPSNNVSWLQSCSNSMSYQNTLFPPNTSLAMPNFNYAEVTNTASWYYVAPRA